jgi:hypothetical protein
LIFTHLRAQNESGVNAFAKFIDSCCGWKQTPSIASCKSRFKSAHQHVEVRLFPQVGHDKVETGRSGVSQHEEIQMASAKDWAAFFTGTYKSVADMGAVEPAEFTFSATGDQLMLGVTIRSAFWNERGSCQLNLRTGTIKGVFGGQGYGAVDQPFYLVCWELVADGAGGYSVGFNPSGVTHIRWEGKTQATGGCQTHTLQFNSAQSKTRPDKNYPWNLPPYGPG